MATGYENVRRPRPSLSCLDDRPSSEVWGLSYLLGGSGPREGGSVPGERRVDAGGTV